MIRSTARLYSFRRSISVSPLVTFDHRSSDSENNKLHANNLPIIAVLPRYRYSAPLKQQFRNYSATTALFNEDDSVDAVMDKLFEDSKLLDDADQLVALQAETAAANAAETAFVFEPVWYNAPDQVIRVMTYAHDTLGLDWTATILCGTLILRLGLVPFTITQRRASSRLMHMRPEMEMIQSQIQQQRELGMTMAEQKAVRERMHALYKRYDVKTSRIFISPLVSIPTMISFFFGIRKLDMIYPEQMSVEGWWWFTDLTACDSTYVLPLVSALFFMINVELGKGELQTAQGAMKHMLPFLRFMGLTIFPVSCYFPSALLIYWIPRYV
jgi:membrane protein insertase Oxa1/YidC/SpoIIIJ